MKIIYYIILIFLFGCTSTKTPIVTPSKTYNFVKIVSVDKDGLQAVKYVSRIK